jgi:hypothetical protein
MPWRHMGEWSGELHAPAALSHGKSPRSPLDRRLGGHQSQFGWRGEDKILPLLGLKLQLLGRPARSQSLYRLRYACSQESESRYNRRSVGQSVSVSSPIPARRYRYSSQIYYLKADCDCLLSVSSDTHWMATTIHAVSVNLTEVILEWRGKING